MALQIEITGPELTDAGEAFKGKKVNAEYALKIWKDGDNPTIDEPAINKKFSCGCKIKIKGKALGVLIERAKVKAIEYFQPIIDRQKKLLEVAEKDEFKNSAADIQNRLIV